MSTARHLFTSMPILILAALWASFAEGHFLTSTESRLSLQVHDSQDYHHLAEPDQKSTEVHPFGEAKDKDEPPPRREPKFERHLKEREEKKKEEEHKKVQYPFINNCHLRIQAVFGKNVDSWYMDWKLWVGFTVWAMVWIKWLAFGYDEIYYQRALFAFGINIVILHILQYAQTIFDGMICVAVILGAQAVAQSAIWFHSDKSDSKESDMLDEFKCATLYLDLTLPPEQIMVLFVAQLSVWWFYMTSILHNFSFDHVNYMYWLVAYMVMQMTMIFCRGDESALGEPFPCYEVWRLVSNAGKIKVQEIREEKDEKTYGEQFKISKVDMFMRGVMGFFVNGICREIMAYTIPLMLMGFEQPMDFVVYCVGVNFICTLDDMKDKTFELSVTHRLKIGDEVVAQKPSGRDNKDNPWLAGVVTEVDTEAVRCTIQFEGDDEGKPIGDVQEDEVFYLPGRAKDFAEESIRADLNATPVHIQKGGGLQHQASARLSYVEK